MTDYSALTMPQCVGSFGSSSVLAILQNLGTLNELRFVLKAGPFDQNLSHLSADYNAIQIHCTPVAFVTPEQYWEFNSRWVDTIAIPKKLCSGQDIADYLHDDSTVCFQRDALGSLLKNYIACGMVHRGVIVEHFNSQSIAPSGRYDVLGGERLPLEIPFYLH